MDEQSNEITAIPKLLDALEIKGCIVTIDAMGTQTEIAKKITDKGADYILSLKANQPTLYEDVKLFFDDYRNDPAVKSGSQFAKTTSQGHGRTEFRECFVCENIDFLPKGLERFERDRFDS